MGYIDTSNQVIIPIKYDNVLYIEKGQALIINQAGDVVYLYN